MIDNKIDKINIRFKEIRDYLKLNQIEFAELSKINQSQISEIENGKRNITAAIILLLEDNVYVNRKWLETGIGEMFTQNRENIVSEHNPSYEVIKLIEPELENSVTKLKRYITHEHDPIPVYDDTDGVHDIEQLLSNENIKPVVIIMKGHLKCDAVVRHNDAAMNKDFLHDGHLKCQLGIKQIFNFKKRIVPGMAAIIMLDDFTITRYVFQTDNKDELLLRSADPESFPDMIIETEEIKQMWKIKSITPVVASKILMY